MALQLLVFDTRRGNKEGEEDDKVLACFPSTLPLLQQSGLAGLLQGLLLFTANFTAASRPGWDVAETDSGTWVLLEAEPCVWLAALAPRAWLPRHTTEQTLRSLLTQLHLLTTVLCGSIQSMLDEDPSGTPARSVLQAVLDYAGRQLGSPHSWQHRELRNPVGDAALPPLLQLAASTALSVQSLSRQLLLAKLHGRQVVRGVMLVYGPHLLWSSLAPGDTAGVFALLATGLLHATSSSKSGSHAAGSSNDSSASSAAARLQGPPSLQALEGSSWQQLPSGFLVQRSAGDAAAAGQDAAPAVLRVHLQHSLGAQAGSHGRQEGSCRPGVHQLLPLLHSRLLVALLLDGDTALTPQLLAGLHSLVAGPARHLAVQLGEEARASKVEPGHVPGFRYLFRDEVQQAAHASPRIKVSTMSHHARALAAAVRGSLGSPLAPAGSPLEAAEQAGGGLAASQGFMRQPEGGPAGPSSSAVPVRGTSTDSEVLEMVAKSSQDCWAYAVNAGGGRHLLAIRERRTEHDLPEAAAVLENFAASNFLL